MTELEKRSKSTSDPSTEDRRIYQGILQPRGFPALPRGWSSEWETFLSADGKVQLFGVLHSRSAGPVRRVLVVSHGLGEHGGRYLHFPHFLEKHVDAVYCLDHRGHGRSEGLRGHVERFDLFSDDLALAIRRLGERLTKLHGAVEIHLVGHSLGGLIALRALLADTKLAVRSVALSAPLLGIRVEVPAIKKMLAGTLSRVWGSLQMLNELDARELSHDPAVVEAYLADRLVHKKITPRLYTQMVATYEVARRRDSGLAAPLLMLIPEEDRITDSGAAMNFFRGLKHRAKELKTYPGFYHEAFNETGKEKVFEDLAGWINRNAGS